jgi:hypothetical protein
VSKASDDLPEPLTPVMTTNDRGGNVRSTFLRLWVRAPRMTIWLLASVADDIYCVLFRESLNSP